MPQSLNVGGAWKDAQEIYVPVDDAPRRVFSGHINVGGAWKVFHIQGHPDDGILDFAINRAWPES
ncbi:hypothetical protein [Pusillimonas noertemannii]|uniref:Uncharacterized protein n=1 Tax=Pusillimonas noertemannii TaxID=305977 RepID=A0A2U1CRZ5_9BURK|nr:hypothetical protein [Pusillimonas noertemannii]NYT67988.1 hypothetical protein [Pusillimonas noertemannii]PVY68666.1 hypothetical protein C7440_1077 [Pusillimonas noertemannii]TFL11872.1 hypothetical protein CSC72_01705 [Pusillimonas noertemannii]